MKAALLQIPCQRSLQIPPELPFSQAAVSCSIPPSSPTRQSPFRKRLISSQVSLCAGRRLTAGLGGKWLERLTRARFLVERIYLMQHMGRLQFCAIAIACLGMILPAPVIQAAGVEAGSRDEAVEWVARAVDVALRDGGILVGQAVDTTGNPLSEVPVSVWQSDREVAKAATNQAGWFVVKGLQNGTYQIVAGPAGGVYQLWTPNTAPPSARQSALVVAGGPRVRGQQGPLGHWLCCNPWILAGIVAAAVAIPVGIHNARSDRAPSSP